MIYLRTFDFNHVCYHCALQVAVGLNLVEHIRLVGIVSIRPLPICNKKLIELKERGSTCLHMGFLYR